MEDTHRRAVLASSLIRSVISRTMQLEWERQMERGQIGEVPCHRPPPTPALPPTPVSPPTPASPPRCRPEGTSVDEADVSWPVAAKAELLSLDMASGSQKDGTLESGTDCEDDVEDGSDRAVGRESSANPNKTTKMSRLFVPCIQPLSNNVQKDPKTTSFSPDVSKPPDSHIDVRSSGEARSIKTEDKRRAAVSRGGTWDRVPHFMVRDVRDQKGKVPTPIHQVRDVRKLLKSSYHFVPEDNRDNKHTSPCPCPCPDRQEPRTRHSSGKVHSVSPIVIRYQSVKTNANETMLTEDKLFPEDTEKTLRKQDNVLKDNVLNQAALEKLQAAVKTMEQLYVFEKKEWRRTDRAAPDRLPGGGQGPDPNWDASAPAGTTPSRTKLEDRDRQVPRSVPACLTSCPPVATPPPKTSKHVLLHIRQPVLNCPQPLVPLRDTPSGGEVHETEVLQRFSREHSGASSDSDNYLSIPVRLRPADNKSSSSDTQASPPGPTGRTVSNSSASERCSTAMDTSSASIYCLSPAARGFQTLERKVLLDPSSGDYYLVDTPVQMTTRRLFDPAAGQYVDVPLSQLPVAPVPIPVPHVALGPSPTLVLYPSFVPTASLVPTQPLLPALATHQDTLSSQAFYLDSPFYLSPGARPLTAAAAAQPGPRLLAPPPLDGTAVSFMVEHR